MSQEDHALNPTGAVGARSALKKLISGSAIYGAGTVLVQTVNLLLLPILTAYLSPAEFGAIALLNFLSMLVFAVFSFGLSSSIGICYFDNESTSWRDSVVSSAFLGLLISCAGLLTVGALAATGSARLIFSSEGYEFATYAALVGCIFSILVIPFDNRLRLEAQQMRFVLASLVSTTAVAGSTLLFVIWLQRGVVGYFEGVAAGRIVALGVFAGLAGRLSRYRFSIAIFKRLLQTGVPLVPQFLILYFMQYGNIHLLKEFSGLGDAGVYSAGLTVGLAGNVVISSIGNAWAPFFLSYAARPSDGAHLFGQITKYYVLGVGLFSLGFYYFAAPLLSVLSAPAYAAAESVVGPVASSMYMLGLFNMLLPPVYFAKEVSRITGCAVAAALVQLGVGALVLSQFGFVGAAWVSLGVYVLHTLLLYLINISRRDYLAICYPKRQIVTFLFWYFASCIGLGIWLAKFGKLQFELCALHLLFMSLVSWAQLDTEERAALGGFVRTIGLRNRFLSR
jgi:O-antigen/teichoic acid export membrane protein